MSKKPLHPVIEELLDTINGPPTDQYQQELEAASKHLTAGEKTSTSGHVGGKESAKVRRGPDSKWAKILAAAESYAGSDSAKIATIARKTGSTQHYVRRILRKAEP